MKPQPLTRATKLQRERIGALDSHVAASAGPFDPASLSRSYGVDLSDAVRVLKSRGKHNG